MRQERLWLIQIDAALAFACYNSSPKHAIHMGMKWDF